ncbi:MAG: hypothetical protein O2805_04500 [Proteobacteria bacterium]|nr:hypothetical protein [Pseudomonadota bacterium]
MLKQALAANTAFSAISGAFALLASDWLSAEIPAPGWFWIALGIGLLAFAVQLAAMLMKPALMQALTMPVVAADIAWVVLATSTMLVFLDGISRLGITLILAVNLVVALLATLQFLGYRAMSKDHCGSL